MSNMLLGRGRTLTAEMMKGEHGAVLRVGGSEYFKELNQRGIDTRGWIDDIHVQQMPDTAEIFIISARFMRHSMKALYVRGTEGGKGEFQLVGAPEKVVFDLYEII